MKNLFASDLFISPAEPDLKLCIGFNADSLFENSEEELHFLDDFFKQLTIPELIVNFKDALASKNQSIIKTIWKSNPLLSSYFSGKPIQVPVTNAQGHLETQTWQLPIHELIINFKTALASQNIGIIKAMWENNSLLDSYFSGEPIQELVTNAQGHLETHSWKLTISELIVCFKAALASRCVCPVTIKAMWEYNPLLASYFRGEPIQVPVTNTQGHLETNTWQLTIPELKNNFKAVLASQCSAIIQTMRENNPLFLSYFSGKPIEVPVTNAQGHLETQIWKLTIPELIVNFKAALADQCAATIKILWENNPLLASYFSGKPIKVLVTNAQGYFETQTWQLTISELIVNFEAMWADDNGPLQLAIKTLNQKELTKLDFMKNPHRRIPAAQTAGPIH